jgi:quercetin 2,3-dioxygenase
MLHGRLEHRDSAGNAGSLGPGDVQWMTAGAGVVHSEMPAAAFQRTGGRMHGFQLWVNLPRQDKLMEPRYQDVSAARIPVVRNADGVTVKVLAGEALGARAVIDTRTPIMYLHFTLAPGARVVQPVPQEWNAFAYVFGGRGILGKDGRAVADGQAAIFAMDGEAIPIAAAGDAHVPLEVLLIAGLPLREPVVRYGPFVMNTKEEIVQAVEDFRGGRLGRRA